MSNSCKPDLKDMIKCMIETKCVKSGKTIKECGADQQVIETCNEFRLRYIRCKREQLNMRSRIRGNKSTR